MPDQNTTNLPILDDIIKPGDSEKAVQRRSSTKQTAAPRAAPEARAKPSVTLAKDTASPPRDQPGIAEPFLQDVIASYRPNIDSLTEEILASVMSEMETIIREQIRQSLKRHFPDLEDSR
jgi:hypothetical protein